MTIPRGSRTLGLWGAFWPIGPLGGKVNPGSQAIRARSGLDHNPNRRLQGTIWPLSIAILGPRGLAGQFTPERQAPFGKIFGGPEEGCPGNPGTHKGQEAGVPPS